jgi:cell wall-associated NlpC family hydrolase
MSKIAPTVFIEGAREWLGAPFLIGGRSKKGVDCASFLLETAKKLGVIESFVPRPYGLRQLRDPDFLRKHLLRFCDEVDSCEVGDVLLFRFVGANAHCGLLSENGHLIHAHMQYGCVEVTLGHSLKSRITGIFRPRFYWQP